MLVGLRPLRRLLAALARARHAYPAPRRKTRSRARRSRTAVAWGVVAFLALQVALNAYLELRHPEVYDPEYRDRLVVLRNSAAPDRPLLLVVGSSRVMTDFKPEDLPPLAAADGREVMPFNLSHSGGGPLSNLVQLRRVLRDGFSPRWVVVEVMPPLLGISGQSSVARQARAADLPVLARYIHPPKLYGTYLWERLRAIHARRDAILRHGVAEARFANGEWDARPLLPLGGQAGDPHAAAGPDEVRRMTAAVRGLYFDGLQRLQVNPTQDRAMRELLDLCRERRIGVVLLLTPESGEFRGWYPPAALRLVDDYCRGLSQEYGVPVVDARRWLPDDAFIDGQHATGRGAREFTRRLGREVLEPLAGGRAVSP